MTISKLIAGLGARTDAERREMRAKAEAWLSSGDETRAAQARELLTALDGVEAAEGQARAERLAAMSFADRILMAFERRPFTDTERKVIQALLDHPDSSTTELSAICGWRGKIWHEKFGTLCKNRRENLGEPPPAVTREGPFWGGLLAIAPVDTDRFTLKPEAVEAFQRLGLRAAR